MSTQPTIWPPIGSIYQTQEVLTPTPAQLGIDLGELLPVMINFMIVAAFMKIMAAIIKTPPEELTKLPGRAVKKVKELIKPGEKPKE